MLERFSRRRQASSHDEPPTVPAADQPVEREAPAGSATTAAAKVNAFLGHVPAEGGATVGRRDDAGGAVNRHAAVDQAVEKPDEVGEGVYLENSGTAYARVGDHVASVLAAAEAAAEEIRVEAQADADRIRADAENAARESVEIRAAADAYSSDVRSGGDDYAATKRREADDEAARILERVNAEAERIRSEAEQGAREIVEQAHQRARELEDGQRKERESFDAEAEAARARLQELLAASREFTSRLEERLGGKDGEASEAADRAGDVAGAGATTSDRRGD